MKGPNGELISDFKSISQYGNREGYSPAFKGEQKIFKQKSKCRKW